MTEWSDRPSTDVTEREALRSEMLIQLQDEIERLRAKLERVEKERDEAEAALGEDVAVMFERGRRSANALREQLAEARASMDRARELATDPTYGLSQANRLIQIGRILSGDE